jgi:NADH-quinone oxidoreductase subunit J
MFFKVFLVDIFNVLVYGALVAMIWEVLSRRFLMEKIFSLILVFVFLSFALLLSGVEFLSLVILLLYVGAIAVLFLFVVMILNPDFQVLSQEKKELQALWEKENALNSSNVTTVQSEKKEEQFNFLPELLGFLWGLLVLFVYEVKVVLPFLFHRQKVDKVTTAVGTNYLETQDLPFVYVQYSYDPTLLYKKNMQLTELGQLLYTKYGFSVIIIGALLLVSMIGSILLCLNQSLKLKRQNISKQSKRYKEVNINVNDEISIVKKIGEKFNINFFNFKN